MLLDPPLMKRDYKEVGAIAEGADGIVKKFRHKRHPGRHVAVKWPVKGTDEKRKGLELEINNVKDLKCDQVISLLGWDDFAKPYPPALYYEYADFGDAWDFSHNLRTQYGHVPEETVWKLFADMAKALHYLHNEQSFSLIHGDFKPENILVTKPVGCQNEELPILPNFKLADFARAVRYHPNQPRKQFFGTPEYAPPLQERNTGVSPATDIWGLGATLQSFALGFYPVQSFRTFIKGYMKRMKGKPDALLPGPTELYADCSWRDQNSVIWRPLNATAVEIREKWEPPYQHYPHHQYSNSLNRWYTMCMEVDMHRRTTAEELVKWFVPIAARQIAVIQAQRTLSEAKQLLRCTVRPEATHSKAASKGPTQVHALPDSAVALSSRHSVDLKRKDFGLPPRRPRKNAGSEDSNELRSLRRKEQKYLRGMRKKL